jgi:hypothetical protein
VNRLLPASVLALGLLLGMSPQRAGAQYAPYSPYAQPNYGPYSRPVVSPYLNIIRGNNPAVNYYTGTIPERENRIRFNQVNTELQNLDRRTATPTTPAEESLIPTLPETGHAVTFLNLTPYYNYGTSNPAPGSRQNQRPLQQGQRR